MKTQVSVNPRCRVLSSNAIPGLVKDETVFKAKRLIAVMLHHSHSVKERSRAHTEIQVALATMISYSSLSIYATLKTVSRVAGQGGK